ncbi:PP2C family protein-serine/threonine phosphatase [Oryzibacter oryziterrae]|uniref:PP2C family protein-serine/threonine phosphatase n=1 Tax=Oryzibacter oryziterrae TaxID=2766474 RepID=UPI001EFFC47D|nr:response regulator [Oryzibacter oryziterrae]
MHLALPNLKLSSRELRDPGLSPATDDARILVVDDSPTMLTVIVSTLRRHGFVNVVSATDGQEAMEAILARAPDLIITDLLMPTVDGFELCRWIRSHESYRDIPILAETGLGKSEGSVDAFASGATDLIMKPINTLELIARVKVHLERRRLLDNLLEFRRHMEMELASARSMQHSILPSSEAIEQIERDYALDIGQYYKASQGLGGDIWNVIDFGTGVVAFFAADFSGHGVSAALNTFRLHTFLDRDMNTAVEPDEFLRRVNVFLCNTLPLGQFATIFCGLIDVEAGELRFASAAAPPMLLCHADGQCKTLECSGLPLGVSLDADFEAHKCAFPVDSQLLLYSDALIETPDPPESIYTPDSLRQTLQGYAGLPAAEVVSRIVTGLYERSDEKPEDDLTVVVIRRLARQQRGDAA